MCYWVPLLIRQHWLGNDQKLSQCWPVVCHHMASLGCNELINTLRPRQNGHHFADDKCIFLNENVWISIKILLKFVPKGPINNIPALVQIMAWCLTGNKPISEAMMVNLLMHICVSRPQWVNRRHNNIPINLLLEAINKWINHYKTSQLYPTSHAYHLLNFEGILLVWLTWIKRKCMRWIHG